MALDNLISIFFTQQELDDIDSAITIIENIVLAKAINLTPEERIRYASIDTEMTPWVIKCRAYMTQAPNLVPGYIDLTELDNDLQTRNQITPRLNRINSIREAFDDTNLLIGSDILTNLLAYYRVVREAAKSNVPGSTAIYQDLAQQFPGRPASIQP